MTPEGLEAAKMTGIVQVVNTCFDNAFLASDMFSEATHPNNRWPSMAADPFFFSELDA